MLLIILPVDPFKAPPPLSSKGNYNGTSCANIYKKQAALHKAAAGLAKISGFFTSIPKPTRPPMEVFEIKSSSSEDTSSNSGEKDGIDTVQFQSIHRPCDTMTRLTKFSFRHLAFGGVTRSRFRQVSD